jgi:hypothetical protein
MSLTIVFFLVFLLPQFALAHHGGSEYDMSKTVEFKRKLTSVELINPHSATAPQPPRWGDVSPYVSRQRRLSRYPLVTTGSRSECRLARAIERGG